MRFPFETIVGCIYESDCFVLQDRISQLELDLEEERQNGDQLMDRIDRGRDQVRRLCSPVTNVSLSHLYLDPGLLLFVFHLQHHD